MFVTAVSIFNLLLAVALLELGSGLQGVLIPIRGEHAGFETTVIGGLGTAYYVSFVVGCLLTPRLIRRVGHIRTFAALAAIAACVALAHGLVVDPWMWIGLRLVLGYCFAGLFMVIESWLNELATPQTRGRTLALYMVATWLGVTGGKMLFSVAPAESIVLFALACIVTSLSLVPVALTSTVAPTLSVPKDVRLANLYRTAPIGVVGCAAVGLTNGAFWTFAPIFAQVRGGTSLAVSLFMTAAVLERIPIILVHSLSFGRS